MKLIAIVFFSLTVNVIAFGQSNDSSATKEPKELCFDFCLSNTSILHQNFWGFNVDAKFYCLNKHLMTGLYVNLFEKLINDTFQYSIKKPIMDFYEFGWINQYYLIQKKNFRLNLNLSNWIAYSRLGDNSEKEKRFNGLLHLKTPKEISTNYYYLLEPGLDISYKTLKINKILDLYITAKAKYRFLFGKSKYSSTDQFSNYYIAIGISLIGLDK